MHRPGHLNRASSLATLVCLLLLLLFTTQFAAAAPAKNPLDPQQEISEEEYMDYLRKYYPQTDRYLLYTGQAKGQLQAFQDANRGQGWFAYDDFFSTEKSDYYDKAFPPVGKDSEGNFIWRHDNAETSSRAIARLATGRVTVFGGIDRSKPTSTYMMVEDPALKKRLADPNSGLTGIDHMAKDATDRQDVMATEDSKSNFHYQNGYAEGTLNDNIDRTPPASPPPECKRDASGKCSGRSGTGSDPGKVPYGNPAAQAEPDSRVPAAPRPVVPETPKIPKIPGRIPI